MLAASVIIGGRLARRAMMITAGWMLDETANAGRENLDADHVARYDRKEDAGASAEVDLLRSLGMGRESVVVDLGAGTGQFALAAAPFCARVIAADVSPVMLRALRSKVAQAELANIDVVQAGFLSYEHHGRPADVVYSRYALHHLPDAWKAVALVHMRRMLAADGIVRLWDVVYGFPPDEAEERIEQWCATGSEDVGGGWYREELEEHVREEHSTYTWLLEPMIVRAGFRIRTADYSNDGFFAKYVLDVE
jgi:ubiquinone/menaquinone biosynthesis C-methylase UbiE